ncbi:MAG: putative ABC transport system permease protein, partial [Candidatus Latescibacterota bacterium]
MNSVGKVISLEIDILPGDYKVTGVVRRPENTSMMFDMIVSSNTPMLEPWFQRIWQTWMPSYYINSIQTYVVLHKETDIEALEKKLFTFAEKYLDEETRKRLTYTFQPLTRMYLYTTADYGQLGFEARNFSYGNIQHVYLFSGIACLIMLIACVNFMNLSTARSANRAKEVGMRKASGAYRFQLIRQFLGEAILLSGVAFVLAAGLVELAAAPFNAFVGTDVFSQVDVSHYLIVPFLIVFVGLFAGSYPAFFLSAFEPISVLTGSSNLGLKGALLKKGLVVFQFSVSILLIIGTITIYRQLS